MSKYFTVSGAARALEVELGAPVLPRRISDLFYQRRLPDCPIVRGHRIIPHDLLPQIKEALLANEAAATEDVHGD